MSDHEESYEPALGAERMAALDNTRLPGAHVEEELIAALRDGGILRAKNSAAADALQHAPSNRRRKAWTAAITAVAATLIFMAGVKVGELRSDAQSAHSGSGNVASNTPPSHFIWY